MLVVLLVIIAIVVILVAAVWGTYNSLVKLEGKSLILVLSSLAPAL